MKEKTQTALAILVGVFVLIIVIAALADNGANTKTEEQEPEKQVQKEEDVFDRAAKISTLTKYKIIKDVAITNKDASKPPILLTLMVFTTSKNDEEIKALNNFLKEDYKASRFDRVEIQYFDDAGVADGYNEKIAKVSETESDRMFKHYTYTYTADGLQSKLMKQVDGNWETIENY